MHNTVLLKEAVERLNLKKGDIVVDATLGAGGHSIELAKLVGEKGKVICFDVDLKAIEEFQGKIERDFSDLKSRFELINDNFANISE
nr:16S rRNA (cytosine(1402)-N(4))-methyltransferase [Patescibacteria group bacterium]